MEKKKFNILTKKPFSWVKAEVHINDKFENTNDSDAEKEVKLPGYCINYNIYHSRKNVWKWDSKMLQFCTWTLFLKRKQTELRFLFFFLSTD